MIQVINSLIKYIILFGILYLIYTNFATFMAIIFVLCAIAYFTFQQFLKKLKQTNKSGFKFTFNGQDFSQAGKSNFDFRGFEEQFKQGNFQNQQSSFNEINEAKNFFDFSHEPTKDEIKKRYKQLARKYHPDINDQDDTLMQKLNHYKDVLLNAYAN